MNTREFSNPSARYRGITLWMLNDKLELDELLQQFEGFEKAGLGGVILRTFTGLRTNYLGRDWNNFSRKIINVGKKKKGLKIWLQAGHMPSHVPNLPLEEAHQVLVRKKAGETIAKDEKVLLERNGKTYLSGHIANFVDYLSPKAVAKYLQEAYNAPLAQKYKKEFGKDLDGVWVDEPQFFPPAQPWASDFPQVFERMWGYSIIDNLPSLFEETGDFRAVRYHYWRVVTEMLAQSYFAGVSQWCEKHHVRFAGHLMGEDTLQAQIAFTGATMPMYKYMQMPGIDHLTGLRTWPTYWCSFLIPPKQCSSAAHQFGQKEILAEMYGVSTQGITFQGRKSLGDWMNVLGINTRCVHGSFYSMRGRRKRIYVPHISHQQPWWKDNRIVADYFGRQMLAFQQGQYQADVLVLHPMESAYCVYDVTKNIDPYNRMTEPKPIQSLQRSLVVLSENLMSVHRAFDYGDESILKSIGKVEGKKLRVGKMSYRVIVMPELISIRRSTLNLLLEFMKQGGKVISCAPLPQRLDGKTDKSLATLLRGVSKVSNSPEALKRALDAAVSPEVDVRADGAVSASSVWAHTQQDGDSKIIFLTNISTADTVKTILEVKGDGVFEEWNLTTGKITSPAITKKGKKTSVKLSFAPAESRLVIFKLGKRRAAVSANRSKTLKTFTLQQPLCVKRQDPNALTLDFCRYRKGTGAWSENLPVIAVQEILTNQGYKGPVTMEFRFNSQTLSPKVAVAIEDAAEWKIIVNSQAIKPKVDGYYIDASLHPVDITPHVKIGENIIQLTREFSPVPQSKSFFDVFKNLPGVELESIYIIGDFGVKSFASRQKTRSVIEIKNPTDLAKKLNKWDSLETIWQSPEFAVIEEPTCSNGQLTTNGYPFYAGRMVLSGTIHLPLPKRGERAVLVLPGMKAAVARVRVNGQDAGAIPWAPYECEISPFLHEGENKIEIELAGTLRNLHGPHHRVNGEWAHTRGSDYSGSFSHAQNKYYPNWLKDRNTKKSLWTDDYALVPFGISGKPVVRYETV